MLYTSQELFLYDCNRAVKITACAGGCSHTSQLPAAPLLQHQLPGNGCRTRPDEGDTAWECRTCSGLLWLTSPAQPWPQASPAFCTVSLAPATSPLPHEGLLHLPASISASCPSCPAFLIQPHCRQHMEHSHTQAADDGGFGKYYSTAAGQGSEGGLGQDLVPVHCRMATG